MHAPPQMGARSLWYFPAERLVVFVAPAFDEALLKNAFVYHGSRQNDDFPGLVCRNPGLENGNSNRGSPVSGRLWRNLDRIFGKPSQVAGRLTRFSADLTRIVAKLVKFTRSLTRFLKSRPES